MINEAGNFIKYLFYSKNSHIRLNYSENLKSFLIKFKCTFRIRIITSKYELNIVTNLLVLILIIFSQSLFIKLKFPINKFNCWINKSICDNFKLE